jgi:tetratricopeptide (TPR) repeat protein
LAEDAFKRKDFVAALDAYVEALGMHPMWPEGHYNAALLAAELKDYELAARHMRRYLALAPDAKDASAAKDKYLLWQHKAKQ